MPDRCASIIYLNIMCSKIRNSCFNSREEELVLWGKSNFCILVTERNIGVTEVHAFYVTKSGTLKLNPKIIILSHMHCEEPLWWCGGVIFLLVP